MRLHRHTGPITHPQVDPPVAQPWEDECRHCGGVLALYLDPRCPECGRTPDEDMDDEDEGTDP